MQESQKSSSSADETLSVERLRQVEASGELVELAVADLIAADSPRRGGERDEHVRVLAEAGAALPPILVHRPTLRVIDGMHRLRAAHLRGSDSIRARLLDCTDQEAFLISVQSNVEHGLPLRLSDRRDAARRILQTNPQWSDRSIGVMTGLSHKTVAAVRRRSGGEIPQSNYRVGRDGRVQQVRGRDRSDGSRIAGTDTPQECADGSPVIRSLPRSTLASEPMGDPLDLERQRSNLEALLRDPSLRLSDSGRCLLRLLSTRGVACRDWSNVLRDVPPHCAPMVIELASHYSQVWQQFGEDMRGRATKSAD